MSYTDEEKALQVVIIAGIQGSQFSAPDDHAKQEELVKGFMACLMHLVDPEVVKRALVDIQYNSIMVNDGVKPEDL